MATQENVALARSLLDLYNNRQSDPTWLDKSAAAFAADAKTIDGPSGATLHGPEGYKRLMLFFEEVLPEGREEVTNAIATEDQVFLRVLFRGPTRVHGICPQELLQTQGARTNCGCVRSSRSGMGRSSGTTPTMI